VVFVIRRWGGDGRNDANSSHSGGRWQWLKSTLTGLQSWLCERAREARKRSSGEDAPGASVCFVIKFVLSQIQQ
jgi:hypothetical protein